MTIKLGISITSLGNKTIEQMKKQAFDQVKINLKLAVIDIHAGTLRAISKTSTGETQTRYNPKRKVTVSKPGDAPNTDSGRLASSYRFEVDELKLDGLVGSNLVYAKALEFGTKDIKARPTLGPAFLRFKRKSISKKYSVKFVGID